MTRQAETAYTITQAAELKNVSPGYIRAAIRATAGPVLRAKRVGKGYRITATALEEWFDSLEDA